MTHRITIIHDGFFRSNYSEPTDLVIQNPPFDKGLWEGFVDRSYKMLNPGGCLVSIIPDHLKSGYSDTSIVKHIRFQRMTQKGRAVAIASGADRTPRGMIYPIETDPTLHVPGLTLRSFSGNDAKDNFKRQPCLAFSCTSPKDLLTRAVIVDHLNDVRSSCVAIVGPIADLEKFRGMLLRGGLAHIEQRFRDFYNFCVATGPYTLASSGQFRKWINEAWVLHGYDPSDDAFKSYYAAIEAKRVRND